MAKGRWIRWWPAVASSVLLLSAGTARAAQNVSVGSHTIVRFFEQTKADGDEATGAPGYEYLRLDAGKLDGDGFSFHGYGWGRHDFGDYYDDSTAGELLTAYGQYTLAATNLTVRLGRQYSFDGVTTSSFDGARVATDLTPYFSLSAYGGLPVSVEEVDGRSGDRTWGGRLAHRFQGLYEVGVSYRRLDDDGDKQVESLGIDSSLTPPGPLSLYGSSTRNLADDKWAEHRYEARLALGLVLLRPSYQHVDYDAFFDTGSETGQPFSNPTGGSLPLKDTGEKLTVLGAEAVWAPPTGLEIGAKVKHFSYEEADETALYYGGHAAFRGKGASQTGVEAGVMDGDDSSDRYKLGRAYLYWDVDRLFFSGDLIYVRYDEEINGERTSLFASLGAGLSLLEKTLAVKVSGDYSRDPYFDKDYRGTVAVEYRFDR